jgi:hypothetical protein
MVHDYSYAGQEDAEYTTMRYETTSAFTATGGAASFLLHKGNSVYRPYSGNTDSAAGYARMYTQYRKSLVLSSSIEVRFWSDTGTAQEPFRAVVFPCSTAQSAIYTAFSNIAQLRGAPHVSEALFSPGDKMPVLRAAGSSATILAGLPTDTEVAQSMQGTNWAGTSGVDPSNLWYFGVGYQNMAGTTTLDVQAQIMIEFKVKWYEPIATAVQVSMNKWGNDMYASAEEEAAARERAGYATETKGTPLQRGLVDREENKGSAPAQSATTALQSSGAPAKLATPHQSLVAALQATSGDPDEDWEVVQQWIRQSKPASKTPALKTAGAGAQGLSLDPG